MKTVSFTIEFKTRRESFFAGIKLILISFWSRPFLLVIDGCELTGELEINEGKEQTDA